MDIQFTRGRLMALKDALATTREGADIELRRISVTCHDDKNDDPAWQEITRDMLEAVASMIKAEGAIEKVSGSLWQQNKP